MLNIPDEIKGLLHLDTCKKNIRIVFPNEERTDICNNLIVLNTVSFKESLCSQETLKFGLCEASVFECEVVGVGNIKGASIEVYCEIYCDPTVTGAIFREDLQAYVYPISYGIFTVNSCKRQGDIIHRKIIAYGGSAAVYVNNDNVQKLRDSLGISTAADYNPFIFDAYISNLKINNRLPNAIYTEITPSGQWPKTIDVCNYVRVDGQGNRIWRAVRCKAFFINYLDPAAINSLYFFEAGSIDYSALTTNAVKKSFHDMGLKGCGLGLSLSNAPTLIQQQVDAYTARYHEGSYVYAYQYCVGFDTGQIKWAGTTYTAIPVFLVPFAMVEGRNNTTINTWQYRDPAEIKAYKVDTSNYLRDTATYKRELQKTSSFGTLYTYNAEKINYAELINALEELKGQFGQVTRDNSFKELNIKQQFLLLPNNSLYPNQGLYPGSPTGGSILPEDYQTCWYDDEFIKPFGAIKCQYKNGNNENILYMYYFTGIDETTPEDTYDIYDLTNNAIINAYTWTEGQIQTICQTIAANIEGVQYIPVDFKGRGLPYVEAGDTFEILTRSGDSITTIVLNKTTTGEQTLTDNYKSNGTGTGTITV